MTRITIDRERYTEALGELRRADLLMVGYARLSHIKDPVRTALQILENLLEEGKITDGR